MRTTLLIVLFHVAQAMFNIKDYGAVGDGVKLNTDVFVHVVNLVKNAGGGMIEVPEGKYLTAPFNLTSNVILHIDGVILGTDDFDLHPVIPALPSYGQGRDHPGPRRTSLIHGEHLHNVTITGSGSGTIDGKGQAWWDAHRSHHEKYTRGHLIEIMYSTDVTISNLLLKDSPFWTVHPYDCKGVVVRNLVIRAPADSPNTDGIDPDSCEDVFIENVDYFGGDDGIAIKSGWDCFGRTYGKPTKNVYIRNMTIAPNDCVCIGSEMSGGVQNVTIEDIRCPKSSDVAYIKGSKYRGGYVKDVTFNGMVVGDAEHAIRVMQDYGGQNPSCPNHEVVIPVFDNFVFTNFTQMPKTSCQSVGQLTGVDSKHNITRVTLSHLALVGGDWVCQDVQGTSTDVKPAPCAQLHGK